jgi:hypothetical protein
VFYCIAMSSLFFVLPRLSAASTVALNFEPIAALVLAWISWADLRAIQIAGAVVTVGAIAWLGVQEVVVRMSAGDDFSTVAIELFDQCRPALEHGALVQVALVGDLVGVDRRRSVMTAARGEG